MIARRGLSVLGLVLLTAACGSSGGAGSGPSSPPASSDSSQPLKGVAPDTSSPASSTPTSSSPTSTGPTSSAATGNTVTSPGGEFTVTLPAGWSQQSAKGRTLGALDLYLGPTAHSFSANVNVIKEDSQGLSLAAYQQASVAGLQKAIKISGLTAPKSTSVSGEPGLEYSFQDTQKGNELTQRQTVVINDGSAYTITATATRPDFAAISPAAQAIVSSLTFAP